MNPFASSRSPLRVAFIDDVRAAPEDWRGCEAARQRVESLAKGLAHLGHFVDIYRTWSPGQPAWEDLYAGVRVHRVADVTTQALLDQTQLSQAVQTFADKVRRMVMHVYPCDAVHAWGTFSGLAGLRLTRGVAVPFVLNMRSACPDAFSSMSVEHSDAVKQLVVRKADRLVADSECDRHALIQDLAAPTENLCVIPPGVDTHVFKPRPKPQARQQLGLPLEGIVVMWGETGPFDSERRRALAPFLRTMHIAGAHVLLLGHAGDVAAMAVVPGVTVMDMDAPGIGTQLRMSLCHAASDLLVHPGGSIDLDGINPREAMACGTPVLAMNVREHDELAGLVQEGVTGHILRRARPEALLAHIQTLQEQPHRRSAMSMASVLKARTFFTWDKVAERYANVYNESRLPSRVRLETRPLTLIRSVTRGLSLVPASI